jgi:hypothetical protein
VVVLSGEVAVSIYDAEGAPTEVIRLRVGIEKILAELDSAEWRSDDSYEGPDREELAESIEMQLQALLEGK